MCWFPSRDESLYPFESDEPVQNGLWGPSTKDVRQNLGFLKPPLPGRPRPDFPTIIFTQLLSLAEKIKKLGQQENKTFNPGRYTNEIQWVNCLLPVQIDNSGRLGENIILWENADVRGEGGSQKRTRADTGVLNGQKLATSLM